MVHFPEYPTIKGLGGHIIDLRRLVDPQNKNWSATNASIGYNGKSTYAATFRSSNYVITPNGQYTVTEGGTIKANVWFSELDKDMKPSKLRKIDVNGLNIKFNRGLEDPKLFWRDGSWYFTCVVLEREHTPTARMGIAKLDTRHNRITSFEKFPGIDSARPEKNWMLPYEPNPNFDWIYGPNATIKDGILTTFMSDSSDVTALRGNSNLLDLGDETYLAVTHRLYTKAGKMYIPQTFGSMDSYTRNYVHYFTRYSYTGQIISMSKGFQFYQPGVEFAAGLVMKGKDFVVSFGRGDVSSHLAVLPIKTVMESLQPIKY